MKYGPISSATTSTNEPYSGKMGSGLLSFSVWEMERRYKVLQSVGVKQLSEFNEFADKNPDNPIVKREGKMPYCICLID
mgnify:CR=1 FL=1